MRRKIDNPAMRRTQGIPLSETVRSMKRRPGSKVPSPADPGSLELKAAAAAAGVDETAMLGRMVEVSATLAGLSDERGRRGRAADEPPKLAYLAEVGIDPSAAAKSVLAAERRRSMGHGVGRWLKSGYTRVEIGTSKSGFAAMRGDTRQLRSTAWDGSAPLSAYKASKSLQLPWSRVKSLRLAEGAEKHLELGWEPVAPKSERLRTKRDVIFEVEGFSWKFRVTPNGSIWKKASDS